METKTIRTQQPRCKSCGKFMKEWNPFARTHEHVNCIAERVSDSVMGVIKKQFNIIQDDRTTYRRTKATNPSK